MVYTAIWFPNPLTVEYNPILPTAAEASFPCGVPSTPSTFFWWLGNRTSTHVMPPQPSKLHRIAPDAVLHSLASLSRCLKTSCRLLAPPLPGAATKLRSPLCSLGQLMLCTFPFTVDFRQSAIQRTLPSTSSSRWPCNCHQLTHTHISPY